VKTVVSFDFRENGVSSVSGLRDIWWGKFARSKYPNNSNHFYLLINGPGRTTDRSNEIALMHIPPNVPSPSAWNLLYATEAGRLYKLVDGFSLPPVAPPIGDTSLTHVMSLAAHSTTSSTPAAMGQLFIMTL
jgi:hypothetical protein